MQALAEQHEARRGTLSLVISSSLDFTDLRRSTIGLRLLFSGRFNSWLWPGKQALQGQGFDTKCATEVLH